MEYRTLHRKGKCCSCYDWFEKDNNKLVVINSTKHKNVILICNDCILEAFGKMVDKKNHKEG